MKSVRVLFDESLLEQLDAHEDVRKSGRSEVLRRAAAEYLRRHGRRQTDERYRRAYDQLKGLGDEYRNWPNEGSWPET